MNSGRTSAGKNISGGSAIASDANIVLPLVTVLAAAGIVIIVYRSTMASMAGVWLRSTTFAHGLLILPIAVALLIRQRRMLARSVPTVSWWALPGLAVCIAAWLAGSLVQANVVSHLAMMAMIPAILLLVFGPSTVGAIGFPIFFSMLAVPAGDFLIAPMMDLTANGSVTLLHLTGVPVFQDHWLISVPAGTFQVADACSGVRYLIGAATFGVLFSYLFFSSWKKRIFFIGFTIILTIVANVLRAYIIILLAFLSDMRLAAGVDHFIYGWLLFSLLLLVVFAVGLRFADAPRSAQSAGPLRFVDALRSRGRQHALAAAVGVLMLVAGPAALGRLTQVAAGEGTVVPGQLAALRMADDVERPRWLQPGTGWEIRRVALNDRLPFEVYVFRGGAGAGGRDVTALREQLAMREVTLVADDETVVVSPVGPLQVHEMRLQQGERKLLLGYWFAVGSERTANPVTAKLMEVRTMLTGEHKRPALIAVVLDINGLDRPGAFLHAIIADIAAGISPCPQQLPSGSRCEFLRSTSG